MLATRTSKNDETGSPGPLGLADALAVRREQPTPITVKVDPSWITVKVDPS